jgi:hypothetical protein
MVAASSTGSAAYANRVSLCAQGRTPMHESGELVRSQAVHVEVGVGDSWQRANSLGEHRPIEPAICCGGKLEDWSCPPCQEF